LNFKSAASFYNATTKTTTTGKVYAGAGGVVRSVLFLTFLLLRAGKLPLFVMGTPKTIGHFRAITHISKHFIEYIQGNFEEKAHTCLIANIFLRLALTQWKG
jgi:hypothetical protein